jgi:hypothetical protein
MTQDEAAAVKFWARQVGRDPNISTQLEKLVPWVFGGEGLAEDLASSLLSDAIDKLRLTDRDALLLARALNAYTEWEPGDPSQVPERVETARRMSEVVRRAAAARGIDGIDSESVDRANSFEPLVYVPWKVGESEGLVSELVAVARTCIYFRAIAIRGTEPGNSIVRKLRDDA